ncbi:MAG: dimethyl sulfoxide reductase anchor subunit [Thiotrichaceae bacterium]|nr:dimethyl sulfoxide reductase anchor subunit [Thiotrichaceae bacterium]
MFKVRQDEPQYAFLNDKESATHNRYGTPIDTVAEQSALRGESLNINADREVGENPNRYKQHGFFFTADNCIACHACEAACSEKNDNPPHIAFRSVGFVEGGTYPDYRRQNISMACNHCDDPVCLKGCPTRAYTKFAEYGAVLQDPDICFGCGYCTWVCPYNAPQLDPVKGQVTKCNMCVDRLEVGLKPACVSACLGKALEFGVVENKPEDRDQAKTNIPGFPDHNITHPNIRFQQTRTLNRDMVRVDSTPIKYHRDDDKGQYESEVDKNALRQRSWGIKTLLNSHENAHAIFTLCVQAVMGAFSLLLIGQLFSITGLAILPEISGFSYMLWVMVAIMGIGLFKLNMHLGKPHRFYRGFYNLRHSPVSREIAGVSAFFGGLKGVAFFSLFSGGWAVLLGALSAALAALGVMVGGYYMYKLYRIKARPFWDHWQTASSFVSTMLTLGALILAFFVLITGNMASLPLLGSVVVVGLLLEAVGLYQHSKDLKAGSGEGQASHYDQTTQFGKSYYLRNGLIVINVLMAIGLMFASDITVVLVIILSLSILVSAYLGRIIFYTVVIPTTMPGAFFWKNKGFVEHARESGLADMQQLGVAYEQHHAFDTVALVKTVKEVFAKS